MSRLGEIQDLVNEAQEKIIEGDRQRVKTVLWRDIKSKLGDCSDLVWPYSWFMVLVIHNLLDESGLEAGKPKPIVLETLKEDLQANKMKVPDESRPIIWLPL